MAQNGFVLSRSSTEELEPLSRSVRDRALQHSGIARAIPPRIEQALAVLLESYDYAHDTDCPVWEFAVELDAFRALNLTASDWRWLYHKGLVEHGRERTMPDESERSFRRGGVLRLARRTCFVLTDEGQQFARQLLLEQKNTRPTVAEYRSDGLDEQPESASLDCSPARPKWDRDRQQLRLGATIVKEFKLPAPNQETILAAFQEENWPPRIDDPLPPAGEIDPKRRLHDTINSLNRSQKEPLIRFLGDGSGQGVRWEFSECSG